MLNNQEYTNIFPFIDQKPKYITRFINIHRNNLIQISLKIWINSPENLSHIQVSQKLANILEIID